MNQQADDGDPSNNSETRDVNMVGRCLRRQQEVSPDSRFHHDPWE